MLRVSVDRVGADAGDPSRDSGAGYGKRIFSA